MYTCSICRRDLDRIYELFYNYRRNRYFLCGRCIDEYKIVYKAGTSMFLIPGPSRDKIITAINNATMDKSSQRDAARAERDRIRSRRYEEIIPDSYTDVEEPPPPPTLNLNDWIIVIKIERRKKNVNVEENLNVERWIE